MRRRNLAALGIDDASAGHDARSRKLWGDEGVLPAGRAAVAALGIADTDDWTTCIGSVLPAAALGFSPTPETRLRLKRGGLAANIAAHDGRTQALTPAEARRTVASAALARAFPGIALPPATKGFRADALTRSLLLHLAGAARGDAAAIDRALAAARLGAQPTRMALCRALIVAAMKRAGSMPQVAEVRAPENAAQTAVPAFAPAAVVSQVAPSPAVTAPPAPAAPSLADFAGTVRVVAARQSGTAMRRVAIAQVYDAGVAGGLAFGELGEFKRMLAAAAREGLIPLERYDIAGPMDPALRERSRMTFGRDERHFIVQG